MKKYKETIEKKIKQNIEFIVADCVNCGSDKIELFNNECYNNKKIAGGKCMNCLVTIENEHSNDCGLYKSDAAYIWNKSNDIRTLITLQEVNIKIATDEIKRLNDLIKKRNV